VGASCLVSTSPATTGDSRGSKEEQGEDKDHSEDGLSEEEQEEEEDDEADALSEVEPRVKSMKLICSWLKRCCRVTDALHLLMSRRISSILRARPVNIHLLPNPPRDDITQLSLRTLLERLQETYEFKKSSLARENLDILLDELLKNENMKQFEQSKKIGSVTVHCESTLASFLKRNQEVCRFLFSLLGMDSDRGQHTGIDSQIAVSRRCCYICRLVLHGSGFRSMEFHNKVYPWAPPLHLESSVIWHILKVLRTDCIKAIEQERRVEQRRAGFSWADVEPTFLLPDDIPLIVPGPSRLIGH
jgi:hypothetical protein